MVAGVGGEGDVGNNGVFCPVGIRACRLMRLGEIKKVT